MPIQVFGKKGVEPLRNKILNILKDMETRDPEIEGSILLRSDGLVVAAAVREEIDKDLASAMMASLLNVSKRVFEELGRGSVDNVIVRGERGTVMIISVTPEVVLAAISKRDANLGLLLLEMRKASEKIKEVLEQ